MVVDGMKFLGGVEFFRFDFKFSGLGQIGLGSVMLAVCVEAAMAGLPCRSVGVGIEVEDELIDQIEEEFEALKQSWRVVSAALSNIPGTGRVNLVTDVVPQYS